MLSNGHEPEGFRAPVRLVLTQIHLVAGVPRDLFYPLVMGCIGLGLLLDSWGAIGIFALGYFGMRQLTKRDPWWPQVWWDYLRYWLAMHPAPKAILLRAVFCLAGGLVLYLIVS